MDVRPVRLYSDSEWLPAGVPPVPFLYPLWGMPRGDPADPRSGAFDNWIARGRESVSLTSMPDAELVVLPFDFIEVERQPQLLPLVHRAADRANAARKPFVVFYDSQSTTFRNYPSNVGTFIPDHPDSFVGKAVNFFGFRSGPQNSLAAD